MKTTVTGRFDGASKATVEVNAKTGLISVRPFRRRQKYTLPLSEVAEIILWRCIKAEVAAPTTKAVATRKRRTRLVSRGLLTVVR